MSGLVEDHLFMTRILPLVPGRLLQFLGWLFARRKQLGDM